MVAMSAASSVIAASLMWPSSCGGPHVAILMWRSSWAFLALRRRLARIARPRQALERRDLAEELLYRLGRWPGPARTGGNVMHHAGLRSERRAGPDRDMIGDTHLPARHDVVSDDGAARYAGLRRQNAVPADQHIVGDLHEIVVLGGLARHGIPHRSPIGRGVGADLDIVLDDDAAD